MKNIIDRIKNIVDISENQFSRIEKYVNFLLEYNNKINLIGRSTEDDIWNRHIIDCLQILNLIENKNVALADFGSGAGLPGILLSIMGINEVCLFEKSPRKCEFLNIAKNFSENKITIENNNIQDIKNKKFDIIVSRALGNISLLLELSLNFKKNNTQLIFLKGKKIFEEIEEAEKKWKIDYKLFDSKTSEEGKIIKIYDFHKIK